MEPISEFCGKNETEVFAGQKKRVIYEDSGSQLELWGTIQVLYEMGFFALTVRQILGKHQ